MFQRSQHRGPAMASASIRRRDRRIQIVEARVRQGFLPDALGAFLPLRDRTDLRHIEELKERWQIRSTRDAAIGTVGHLG
jgi:hypothetical protein